MEEKPTEDFELPRDLWMPSRDLSGDVWFLLDTQTHQIRARLSNVASPAVLYKTWRLEMLVTKDWIEAQKDEAADPFDFLRVSYWNAKFAAELAAEHWLGLDDVNDWDERVKTEEDE